MKTLILSLSLLLSYSVAHAQNNSSTFEIVDLTGNILGNPEVSQDSARTSWNSACHEWKKETKDLNKNNELISINCNTPTCSFLDSGKSECSSSGTYQIKTAGTRNDNQAPVIAAAPAPQPVIVQQPQPEVVTQVIYEPMPAPRVGFVWMPGFWGWGMHHHRAWHGGYWRHRW